MVTYRTPLSQDYDWQLSVASKVAAPAGGEAKGTRYLITIGSGDFTGYNNYIATAKQASPTAPFHWYFDAPLEGMATYVKDEDKVYQYITSWLELRISCLFDVDRDTGIEVEQSADEDKIHFKTAGTERAIIDSTGLGIGIAVPTTKLHVQVANTINKQALLIEQLDTTNNPICAEINNDGTNHGLYIHQDGVLAASKWTLCVYSNAVQVNAPLVLFRQNNVSSSERVLVLINEGTGTCFDIDNNGTGHALYIHQDGVLAASKYGLYVYSNAALTNSQLVFINQANASAGGVESVVYIQNSSTTGTLFLNQAGILPGGVAAFTVYASQAQVNASFLASFRQGNAGSTATDVDIDNDGTGHALYIHQDGVLAASKYGLYVYSNAVQVNSPLILVYQNNASSTKALIGLTNDGSGADIEKTAGDLILKDANAGTLTLTDLATICIEFVIDGGGDTITTGIKGDLEIPFSCTIQQVTLLADQTGSIVIDIWKDSYSNFPPTDADSITSATPPTISAATKSQNSTLTSWTKTIASGEILRFNVDSVTDIERCTISLKVIKT